MRDFYKKFDPSKVEEDDHIYWHVSLETKAEEIAARSAIILAVRLRVSGQKIF